MPAKDTYHDAVRHALVKDGWTITHDPFTISWGDRKMYADLGAEQFLAAERSNRRIAVEIKSFLGKSLLDDLEKALGQFILYRTILGKNRAGPRDASCDPLRCRRRFRPATGPALARVQPRSRLQL